MQLGRYIYLRLPFGVAPAGNIFDCKIDEIIKELNISGITDDI